MSKTHYVSKIDRKELAELVSKYFYLKILNPDDMLKKKERLIFGSDKPAPSLERSILNNPLVVFSLIIKNGLFKKTTGSLKIYSDSEINNYAYFAFTFDNTIKPYVSEAIEPFLKRPHYVATLFSGKKKIFNENKGSEVYAIGEINCFDGHNNTALNEHPILMLDDHYKADISIACYNSILEEIVRANLELTNIPNEMQDLIKGVTLSGLLGVPVNTYLFNRFSKLGFMPGYCSYRMDKQRELSYRKRLSLPEDIK